ncbi:putative molybdenum carrier protein [Desulfobacterium sp. N47]|uniref:DUF6794 domain-containing protein n=1 Tax=uncultured Desulfobacterium sp. TaxID=201089 RepID=E1YB62_9BACT|nr:hypothetical protein N47_C17970 [uncultured Desulfobacterium sp.]
MLTKVISGGQTGVDRAALDIAIKLEILHGGWISKGRKTEDGVLPVKYKLKEMDSTSSSKRTEENVIKSDGTLVISHGKLLGGLALTQKYAAKHEKPWLHIDLNSITSFKAANEINSWLLRHDIKVLNVTGTRAGKNPNIYMLASDILEAALYLNIMDTGMPDSTHSPNETSYKPIWIQLPKTVEKAEDIIIREMTLKDKSTLAYMRAEDLGSLQLSLGEYIRNHFGLWGENTELLESCRIASGEDDEDNFDADRASLVIITELWKKLQETHKLRVVK